MKRFFLCFGFLIFVSHLEAQSSKLPDFSGFTRRYLVSLGPKELDFIFSDSPNAAHPNYNWSLAYGRSSICTIDEVEKVKNALGSGAFLKYGELINYGWLYDQREFELPLRKFQILLKKDKSQEARIILHVVEKALQPENILQQKRMIENEIERNEKRLSERSGLSREKARELAKEYSRRFNSCLGRYQTGYIDLALQANN